MIEIAASAVAGPSSAAGQLSFVPTATIRKFLDAAGVIPGVRMPNERLAPWSPMRVMYASTVG